jgi:hypothetical protein
MEFNEELGTWNLMAARFTSLYYEPLSLCTKGFVWVKFASRLGCRGLRRGTNSWASSLLHVFINTGIVPARGSHSCDDGEEVPAIHLPLTLSVISLHRKFCVGHPNWDCVWNLLGYSAPWLSTRSSWATCCPWQCYVARGSIWNEETSFNSFLDKV